MSLQVYINGEFYPQAEAKISVYDHGLLYGDGVFEGIRQYNGRVFKLREHVQRLYDSARAITLQIPLTEDEFCQAIEETLECNNMTDAYIRAVVTRGAGYLGLSPAKTSNPQVIIITDTIALYPAEMYEKGMDVVTVSVIRNHPAALSPRIKSLNYLNNILAKIEGSNAGVSEAIMLNHLGEVAECTGDNIFFVRDGVLITPHVNAGILEGITRNTVIELAGGMSVPVHERSVTRHDLYIAQECFLTGTAAEVIPVVHIDGRPVGDGKPGPLTRRLLKAFQQLVQSDFC